MAKPAEAVTPNQSGQDLQRAENRRRELFKIYNEEPKRKVSVSPLYAPYFGKCMQVQINGITIAMPVDGSVHEVPETFAAEIGSRIMGVDGILNKAKKMSDIQNNAEQYPGALQMF